MQLTPLLKRRGETFYPLQIDHSIKLNGTTAYLYRTPAGDPLSATTWTFSCWIKFATFGAHVAPLSAGNATANWGGFKRDTNNVLYVQRRVSDSTVTIYTTNAVFRDPSSWYHIVIQFNATAAAGSRFVIYVNGVLQSVTVSNEHESGENMFVNGQVLNVIGALSGDLSIPVNGHMANIHMVDGANVAASAFGEYVGQVWVPKEYTGTYGYNGYHLDFEDSGDLGKDVSGLGNHWTNNNCVQSEDTPTNNFCVLNSMDTASTGTISNAGLTVAGGVAKPTMRPASGKWYYEKDGVAQTYDADTNGEFNPDLAAGTYNFGATAFSNSITAGYKTLCSKNLPTPEVVNSATGLWIPLYTGSGVARDIEGAQFDVSSGGLVWIKDRANAQSHHIFDTVRGAGLRVSSDATSGEITDANELSAFLSDGFSLGTDNGVNYDTRTFIAWVLRVAAVYGFDIVTYTGSGANRTIAHNLGVVPELIIIKNRDSANNWIVGSSELTSWEYALRLNLTDAQSSSTAMFNSTAPSATVFTLGTSALVNENGSDHVAYLFRSVPGYMQIGSYAGNSNANGPFIHTGFRPAFLVLKPINYAAGWSMMDSARTPNNVLGQILKTHAADAEVTADTVDLLSNGFKLRATGTGSNANYNYLYLAIAEQPFKYANAR